ncbi:hypothetical protein PILCRDRAFT_9849, partial [Piloderma croceum F 1598]
MAGEDEGIESKDEREIEIETPSFPSPSPNPLACPSQPTSQPAFNAAPSLRPDLTRKQRYAKESRARRRAARQESLPSEDRRLKSVAKKKQTNLEALPTPMDTEELSATSTGWTGMRIVKETETYTLAEVTRAPHNLRHVQWDGKTPRPIVDGQDRIIAALAGQPNDPQWDGVSDGAADAVRNAGEACSFTPNQGKHRRGPFPALATGVSFGGGQQASNLLNSTINALVLASLLANISIQQLAGFASTAYNVFAPTLFAYYIIELGKLYDSNPNLKRNFRKSPWPAATFNFGPWTITLPHTDPGNLAFGW